VVLKNPLMQLFGQSPFTPLQEHFRIVLRCANEVPDLLLAAQATEAGKVAEIRDRIFQQESEADTAQDIAGMMVVRDMRLPPNVHEPVMALTRRCVDACNQLGRIMEELDELVETGFRGPEADKVMYMIDELNKIESDTDVHAVNLMRVLFANENEIGAVSTVMWDRVIHWIGDLANFAERAGNRHRLLLAR
jgi:uncharacterized protein Yka (UPF0111/DUF47 family)